MKCLDEAAAARLLAGELEDADAARAHLAECRDCEQFVAELARACVTTDDTGPELDTGTELRRGTMVGRFLVLGRIGSGGMGIVHNAYDPELDRRVALKLLRSREPDARARLLREAQAAARLSHPNVVSVFDIGEFEDRVYLAMELVEGVTLAEWLRGDRSWTAIVDTFLEAGRGIAAAHEAGVIHRDFKPDNVLVGRDGRARVVDFGLARETGASAPSDTPVSRLTQSGTMLGTPRFMAPEQFAGGVVTPATDQFAFCVAMYAALYRTPPFRGDRVSELADCVRAGTISAPASTPGPAALRRAIVRGLAVEPARRHPSMAALLRELERARGIGRRRAYVAGIAVAAIAGAALTFGFASHEEEAVCAHSSSKLDAVWNPARVAKIRSAFGARGLPFGDNALRGVETRVGAYATAWAAMRTEACTATHVDHEQSPDLLDRRIICLDDRLAELSAFVGALETADADTVSHAIDAADRLPKLAACADRVALSATIAPPSPAVAERVALVGTQLGQASTLDRLGKVKPALDAAEAACRDVEKLDYAPILARCRHVTATLVENALGDHARAIDLASQAIGAALAGNDQPRAVDAALALARLLGDRVERYDEAERWTKLAESIGRGDPRELAVRVSRVRGIIATHRGDHAAAVTQFETALRNAEVLDPRSGLPVANARIALGHALLAANRPKDAEPQYRSALAIIEEVSGKAHPDLIPVLDGLGNLYWSGGDPASALPFLERSLAITRSMVPPDHPSMITAQANVAAALANAGQLDRALAELEAARKAVRADDRGALALVLTNLVLVQQQRGDHEHALEAARECLAVEREVKGEDHADTGIAHFNIGDALLSLKRPREAVPEMRQALAIWEKVLPAGHPHLATARTALGDALIQAKDPRAAIPLLERAIEGADAAASQHARELLALAKRSK